MHNFLYHFTKPLKRNCFFLFIFYYKDEKIWQFWKIVFFNRVVLHFKNSTVFHFLWRGDLRIWNNLYFFRIRYTKLGILKIFDSPNLLYLKYISVLFMSICIVCKDKWKILCGLWSIETKNLKRLVGQWSKIERL